MEVDAALVPRIAEAGRVWISERMGQDPSGYTDIQVMRHLTKEHWKGVVGNYDATQAADTAAQGAYDDLDQGVEGP
jgi:hypothetical protein